MQKRILSLLLVLTLLLGTIVPAASAADDPKPELTGWMEITGYEKQSTREPVRYNPADFEPDVILFSCDNNFQLRTAIWAIKNMTGQMLDSSFDAIDSCIHSIVTPMLDGKYRITLPDPGDQERALADKSEIILTVPFAKLPEIHAGLAAMDKYGMGYKGYKLEMKYDFARPPFYNTLYELWGLDTGKDWDHTKG